MDCRSSVRCCLAGALLFSAAWRATPSTKPQVWTRLRSPNFLVFSNACEKKSLRVAYQFEMIRAVLRHVFNVQSSTPGPPVIIIAAKDEATLKPLLPDYFREKGSVRPSGLYLGGPEKNYVALRLDGSLDRQAAEPFEPIYHEYVHYLTRRLIPQLPLWLAEGLAEFYGNTRVEDESVWVGAPSSTNLKVLRQSPLLPLSTLFAVSPLSSFYREENKASIFYAESWALTHYLITRDWREKTRRLSRFMEMLRQDAAPEEAARQTIGEPEALQQALQEYVGRFSFTAARFEAPTKVNEDALKPDQISEAESLAVRGDFLVHTGRYSDARQMLEESLKADPRLAEAYESMGLLYAEQDKSEEANKWFSEAVGLDSQSYIANFYYASNLLKGRLDDESAAKAEACLRTAIRTNPGFAPSYDALAYLLMIRDRGLDEARTLILQAVNIEPGNVHYRLRMAQLLERMERVDEALRVATLAAPMAKTPQEWSEAQATLASIRRFQEYQQRMKEQQETLREEGGEGERRAHEPGPEAASTAPRQRPELLSRREVAEGIITESRCSESATLELTLASAGETRHFFTDDYFKIPYGALNFTPSGTRNPCEDMNGMRARITYRPAKNQPQQGEIVAVQLAK